MAVALLFWTLTLGCCGFAARTGGVVGRWGALLFLTTAALSFVPDFHATWTSPSVVLLAIDSCYLLALWALAVRSHRYWPIWAAGFQAISVVTHLARLIDESVVPKLYRAMESVWAIPILLAMVVGSELDRRAGLGRADEQSGHRHGRPETR